MLFPDPDPELGCPIITVEHSKLVRVWSDKVLYKGKIIACVFFHLFPYTVLHLLAYLLLLSREFRLASTLAAATMPKASRQRANHASNSIYHSQSKYQAPHPRSRTGASIAGEDDSIYARKSSPLEEHVPLSVYIHSSELADVQEEAPLSVSLSPREIGGVIATAEHRGILKAVDQPRCCISDSPSPHPSEASTIFDGSGHDIFAGVAPNARLENFEFELDSVLRIEGDQCQVRWTDSIIRDCDLNDRFLHSKPLLEYVLYMESLGGGLSRVVWALSWEPVDILRNYEDVVQRQSQFEFGDLVGEHAGRSLVQWESSLIHENTLEVLRRHPLLHWVQSMSDSPAHGLVEVVWKPMWVPSETLEAYGGRD